MVIYLDGADLEQIKTYAARDDIAGFTTNPSLMKKAGIAYYRGFANAVLEVIGGKPVSFEVFADDFPTMEKQAREIHSWAPNIYVKVPITNTAGQPSYPLIRRLADAGIKLNVTAVFTKMQARFAMGALGGSDSIVSIFAGRIADTGRDPTKIIRSARASRTGKTKILWASAREVFNVEQARQSCCDIITLSADLIKKMELFGKDLREYSQETVQQFYQDGLGIEL